MNYPPKSCVCSAFLAKQVDNSKAIERYAEIAPCPIHLERTTYGAATLCRNIIPNVQDNGIPMEGSDGAVFDLDQRVPSPTTRWMTTMEAADNVDAQLKNRVICVSNHLSAALAIRVGAQALTYGVGHRS